MADDDAKDQVLTLSAKHTNMSDKSTGDSVQDAGQKVAQVVEVALDARQRLTDPDLTYDNRVLLVRAATTASLIKQVRWESTFKVRSWPWFRRIIDDCTADGAIGSVGESIGGPLSSEGGSSTAPDQHW